MKKMGEADQRERLLKEDRTPATEGIWYYIFLAPTWKLEIFRTDKEPFYGLGHREAWKDYITPMLAAHYKLPEAQARALEEYAQAFPRGRMGKIPEASVAVKPGEEPGHWYFWHGGDFPKGLSIEREKHKLVSAFNVSMQVVRGLLHWQEVDHEKMDAEDQRELQRRLGITVPY